MVSTLELEGLSRSVQTGPGGSISSESVVSDKKVQQDMKQFGMDAPSTMGADAGGNASTFSDILRQSVDKVNEHQHQADQAIKELVAGRSKNIHETMLAVERADTSLKLMMQVRNKMLDAYKEIMRMQV